MPMTPTPGAVLLCPFCGGSGVINELTDPMNGDSLGFFAECIAKYCIATNSSSAYGTEAEAIAAWNTRAPRSDAAVEHDRELYREAFVRGWNATGENVEMKPDCDAIQIMLDRRFPKDTAARGEVG